LTATGGDGVTYTWSLASGSLPAGLGLSPAGVVSGIPTAAGTATFTIQVSSGGRTGSKLLNLTINHPAVTVTTGTPLPQGTLDQSYSETLTATGGDGVTYVWSLASGTLPDGLQLSPAGVVSGTPTAVDTATFTVEVSSGGQTASKVFDLLILNPCQVVGVIAVGDTVSGTLTTSSCQVGSKYEDRWTLSLAASTPVRIDLTSSAFDAYLILTDAIGNVIEENDDGGGNLNSRIVRTLAAGTYRIRTTTYDPGATGAYRLSVVADLCSVVRPIAVGDTMSGTLTAASCLAGAWFEDRWSLSLAASTSVRIDLTSSAFDAFLVLADASGNIIETNDDAGGTSDSRIVRTLAAGTYRIRASTHDAGATGTYQLSVIPAPPPGALDLRIDGVYLTQATQTYRGDVPLVSGRAAFVRVFAQATQANALQPDVRVRLYQGNSLVATYTIPAPTSSVPTSVDEGALSQSWNLALPPSAVVTGLAVLADIDPADAVAESDESNNSFPVSGTPLALDVRTASSFDVTLVPVLQQPSGLLGAVDAGNAPTYVSFANSVYPLSAITTQVHAAYTFNGGVTPNNNDNSWSLLLSEIYALQVAEGTGRYYYGVVGTNYASGIAGIGYVGWPAAVGWDKSGTRASVAAHEWGHNFGRLHVDCGGAGNPDPSYPYAGGRIGVYGFDLAQSVLRSPASYYDLMGYCDPDWISDYTYRAVLNNRAAAAASTRAVGASQPVLLVWGHIGPQGVVLEPAFELTAAPSLPARPGPYRLQGRDAAGRLRFDIAFEGELVDHAKGGRHFAFTVPVTGPVADLRLYESGAELARRQSAAVSATPSPGDLRVSRAGGWARFEWDAKTHPAAMIRDGTTGEVVSIARGGVAEIESRSREFVVILSNGVTSLSHRVTASP